MLRRCWALVLGAGLLVWSGTLNNSFHYDDFHSIVDNIYLRVTSLDAGVIGTYFTEPGTFSVDAEKGMYRPLLVSSFAMNYATAVWLGLGGYHVVGYHVVNIALHLGSALIVSFTMHVALWAAPPSFAVTIVPEVNTRADASLTSKKVHRIDAQLSILPVVSQFLRWSKFFP